MKSVFGSLLLAACVAGIVSSAGTLSAETLEKLAQDGGEDFSQKMEGIYSDYALESDVADAIPDAQPQAVGARQAVKTIATQPNLVRFAVRGRRTWTDRSFTKLDSGNYGIKIKLKSRARRDFGRYRRHSYFVKQAVYTIAEGLLVKEDGKMWYKNGSDRVRIRENNIRVKQVRISSNKRSETYDVSVALELP